MFTFNSNSQSADEEPAKCDEGPHDVYLGFFFRNQFTNTPLSMDLPQIPDIIYTQQVLLVIHNRLQRNNMKT